LKKKSEKTGLAIFKRLKTERKENEKEKEKRFVGLLPLFFFSFPPLLSEEWLNQKRDSCGRQPVTGTLRL
jgi:hypothetical protein